MTNLNAWIRKVSSSLTTNIRAYMYTYFWNNDMGKVTPNNIVIVRFLFCYKNTFFVLRLLNTIYSFKIDVVA